ncbi:uncharacterized protein E0L32_008723 [Thyridium curvatum]|uniref:Man(5)GlcNAc(2)-PP-dolichol translocation protein RFT1 n=1 Tax=Thyridium curvatum TaxID=1093900 RepID=A0A507B001_9PEZI|nr:uncharacterized protein E0L32_008723 [Thyridium curvatum]TPX10318.1 hypothetical protein E0L32_008723 [Thyridium curvatum]
MAQEDKPVSGPSPRPSKGGGGVVRGASLLILLQVGSRALTFVANQVLLRFLTAQLLGISTQLEVYYLSVLFFARESLRVAIQRQAGSGDGGDGKKTDNQAATRARTTQALVNLAYLAILMGIAAAFILGRLYISSVPASTVASTPYLSLSLRLYGIAAVLELLSEPVFVIMQSRLDFGARASAEGIATFLRCFATLGPAVWASRAAAAGTAGNLGTLPFALGQLAYGTGLLAVYLASGTRLARAEGFSLLPGRLRGADYVASYFYQPTLKLAGSMIAQSFVKHILTQGDTFLVSVLSSPTAQGVYALANNYGGLVARLVLQPVEESSRNYFSRLLSSVNSNDEVKDAEAKASLKQAASDLTTLLRLYITLSLPVAAIGFTAAHPLIALVAGPQWSASGAGATLSVFTLYVPLLALNGVLEAFVASVASETQVHAQSAWMGGFSLVFAGAGFLFLRVLDMGARGLVLANGVNMACRIIWCAVFVRSYFRQKGGIDFRIDDASPTAASWAVMAAAAGVVSRASSFRVGSSKDALVELVKLGLIAVPFVAALAIAERNFIRNCYETVRGRRQGASTAAS